MHVSWTAVRLAALAIAATASGYLWRAAFEPSQAPTIIRLAPPALGHENVAEPVHRPQPTHRVVPKRTRAHVVVRRHNRPSTHAVASAAVPAPHTYSPPPTRPAPKPRPKPAPTPKPSTPPAEPSTPPAAAPASAPPTPPQPAQPPPEQAPDEAAGGKPGWGHGDKNHDHGGPPGDTHG